MNIMIILNYNNGALVINLLNIVKHFSIIDKIIVVDNCSTDESYIELLSFRDNKIDIIKSEKNGGYSYGNNFGIFYAEKKYEPRNIIVSNPDITVTEETVERLISLLDGNDEIALVTGLVTDARGDIISNFGWNVPTYIDMLVGTFQASAKIAKLFNHSIYHKVKELQNNEKLFIEVVSGCFFAVKHKAIKDIGYFDEGIFLYCEENILGYKLKKKSYNSCILCNQRIIHFHSLDRENHISYIKNQKNLKKSYLFYLDKYLEASSLQKLIFNILFEIGKYEKRLIRVIKENFTY